MLREYITGPVITGFNQLSAQVNLNQPLTFRNYVTNGKHKICRVLSILSQWLYVSDFVCYFCAILLYLHSLYLKVKVKVWTLAIVPLTWVRLMTSSALQSRKWQLICMSQWCCSALCGHPLPALMDSWTIGCESNPQPLGYESDTLPLHHCTHLVLFIYWKVIWKSKT